MKIGMAGSLESNDALITVKEGEVLSVTVKSIVFDFFHEQIEKVIYDTVKELGYDKLTIVCEDKGALDYTIRARLIAAIKRMEACE